MAQTWRRDHLLVYCYSIVVHATYIEIQNSLALEIHFLNLRQKLSKTSNDYIIFKE
jgi:hypothetical protein